MHGSGEPSDAQAAFLASIERMRRRKEAETREVGRGKSASAIRHTKSRKHKDSNPYCIHETRSSQSKRAEASNSRQETRTAAPSKSYSPARSVSSASSNGPGTPLQETHASPRIPIISADRHVPSTSATLHLGDYSGVGAHISSHESPAYDWWNETEEGVSCHRTESTEVEEEEIVREMFAKYTYFEYV
ncbi:uncharacterized protein FOMMEDRAFT_140076 [Fomitiporia mediterranea MF3/22]|uniref:uncharacterized protein n=1 Tax=Fomitiporia mediterranea (strain MF3/22) TaxID=694068 RepID=UPI00044090E9|nr:uncharacterized protein FOMMEDRAFT_140076 [Fomitiporia mediterranea MF3/22]EJD03983.1 hypothetical protein FOMMEDRAFT_140076 [Fomitiporia mediterranea MF3/22]